jgi:hypothetical protein
VKSRTAFSLVLLGTLVIGGAGLWYRLGSDESATSRQVEMQQEYESVRTSAARTVRQLNSPEFLVDSAAELRDGDRTLQRIEEPAEGELEQRIKLQRRQIAKILQLIRLNADFDTPEKTEQRVKGEIRTMERQLQAAPAS